MNVDPHEQVFAGFLIINFHLSLLESNKKDYTKVISKFNRLNFESSIYVYFPPGLANTEFLCLHEVHLCSAE